MEVRHRGQARVIERLSPMAWLYVERANFTSGLACRLASMVLSYGGP
jgi:hypothetical protein